MGGDRGESGGKISPLSRSKKGSALFFYMSESNVFTNAIFVHFHVRCFMPLRLRIPVLYIYIYFIVRASFKYVCVCRFSEGVAVLVFWK